MAQRKYEIVLEAKEQAKAAIEATTKALREQNEAISFTQNLYKQTLTEEEKFRAGQEKLNQAMMSGKVSLLEYTRALDQLKKGYSEAAAAQRALSAPRPNLALPMSALSGPGRANILAPQGYRPLDVLTGNFHTDQSRALAELVQGIGNNASRSLPQAGPTMLDRFAGGVRSLLPIGAAYAGYRVATGSFNAFLEQDEAEARLRGVLNATGRKDINFDAIQGFAARRQRNTSFGDETTIGAGAVLSTFQNIKGQDFEKTLKLAQDLSTVMGTDLQESAMKLGKALEDPDQFMKQLARSGIVLSDAVKKQITEFDKAGESERAQALLFAELTKRIGGAAEVAGASASGAWAQLKNAIGEVGEAIGGLAAGPMRGLADYLKGIVPQQPSEFVPQGGAPRTKAELAARQRQLNAQLATAGGQQFQWSWNPFTLWNNAVQANNANTAISSSIQQIDALPSADSLPESLPATGGMAALGQGLLAGITGYAPFGGGNRKGKKGQPQQGVTVGNLWNLAASEGANQWALWSYAAANEGAALMDMFTGWPSQGQQAAKEQFDRFSRQYESPAEKRDRLLKELDSYSGFVPDARIDSVRKGIQKDYDDETKKKKKGEDTSLGATESRFLTRGPGLMAVDEQKKTNQKIDITNKKLDALIKAMQMRGDVVLENLV